VSFLLAPSLADACDFAKSAGRRLLVIVGCCRVDYRGRAKSLLDFGERLVIIKRDGSVLVHQEEGREPVNWQPPNTRVRYSLKNGFLVLEAVRSHPRERMTLEFQSVKMISFFNLQDQGRLQVTGMEANIVEQIMENPGVLEPGLKIVATQKSTRSGVIDLFGFDSRGTPVVIEVKRSRASPSAVSQLEAYILDFKHRNRHARVRGMLCAPQIPRMVRTLLANRGLEWREFKPILELTDEKQTTLDRWTEHGRTK